jgi:hypothetical protein
LADTVSLIAHADYGGKFSLSTIFCKINYTK